MKYVALTLVLMMALYAVPAFADHPLAGSETDGDDTRVSLTTPASAVVAGEKVRLGFSLKDRSGKPLQNLAISHERILHVMIISSDFTVFSHIHPEDFGTVTDQMKQEARFFVDYSFPKAGRYLIALDYAASDKAYSKRILVQVAGRESLGSIHKDLSGSKKFGPYTVTLKTEPESVIVGKPVKLTYDISIDGKPVSDIAPYLSAAMHIAVVHSDLDSFIHAHGDVPGMSEHAGHAGHGGHPMGHIHGMPQKKYGPLIEASAVFPAKGLYQIFGEFMHNGKIIVTRFMIDVQ